MSNQKPMREVMPECASFVDALRDVGLFDNATFAQALKDRGLCFEESGHVIGNPDAMKRMDALSAWNAAEQAKADAAWAEECATYPRLMHSYRPDLFEQVSEARHGGGK